jgi:hypothetical protein
MLMDTLFSEIGRATGQHLNNLRRQLGTGVDPAFDYSSMLEMQKRLAQAGKDGAKKRADRAQGEGNAAPASGLDLLKRTLREVVGVGVGLEDEEEEQAAGSSKRARSMPADVIREREQNRNSSAFLASSRHDLKKLDVEYRFRAPPIGSYRPKETKLSQRPKLQGYSFGFTDKTKSRKTLEVEKEIERLQDEGQPYDHLVKSGVSVEVQEGIVEKSKPHMRNHHFHKDLDRPDMIKVSNIQFNDNSFTAGVLDGKSSTSDFQRQPVFDFAKVSTAPAKEREYYFQPGQYAVKFDSSKPKQELKNIPFDRQQSRKPLADHKPAGLHLPDRSLSRPSAMGSCPLLEKKVRDFNIGKFPKRKPINDYRPPDYDVSDPRIEETVMQGLNSYDAFEAMKATKPGQRSCEAFKQSLTRVQHHRTMRSYANDQCLQLARTNITRGPVSIELLPMDSIDQKPSLTRKVVVKDLKTMAGREPSQEHRELPPRKKDLDDVMSFERGVRPGDSRCETQHLSSLATGINELRGSRSYDALPRHEHPSGKENPAGPTR